MSERAKARLPKNQEREMALQKAFEVCLRSAKVKDRSSRYI